MEAQDESTPNTKDGSIDDSSAIFEEEITNNGDFGKGSAPLCTNSTFFRF